MHFRNTIFLLLFLVVSVYTTRTDAAEDLKWRWLGEDNFIFVVSANLKATKPDQVTCELEGAFHIDAISPNKAVFRFLLTKNVVRDNTGLMETPPEALKNASVVGYLDEKGLITGISDPEMQANLGQYFAAWFPPLRNSVKPGDIWDVKIPHLSNFKGTVRYVARQYDEDDNSIAVLEFSYESKTDSSLDRKVTGTARFDIDRGYYTSVKRSVKIRGTRKIKILSGKSSQETTRVVEVEETRNAECKLISSPHNVHPAKKEHARIAALKRRLEADPKDSAACIELGRYHAARKEIEKAKDYFNRSLAIEDNAEARVYLARIYINDGDIDKAEEYFMAATKKSPELPSARLGLGHVHFKRNNFQKSLTVAESIIKDNQDSPGGHYLKGLSLAKLAAKQKQPDFSEATKEIKKYIELDTTISKKKRKIEFEKNGALRVLVEADGDYRFTEEELIYGRQLVQKVLSEAAEELNIEDKELVKVLDFLADLSGTKSQALIDEFIKNRKKTGAMVESKFLNHTKPDAGKIAAVVRGKWDILPFIAATTFQPPDQAREMLLAYSEEAPQSKGEIYLFLAAGYMDDLKANRKKIDENLMLARNLLDDNALPWYLSAHLALLDQHVLEKRSMMSFLNEAAKRSGFSEYRSVILNERAKLLSQVSFPGTPPSGAEKGWQEAIRLSTAASWQPETVSTALRVFL